jgi:hypothetical protein
MPRIVQTFGDRGRDEEIDRLWAALDAITKQPTQTVTQTVQQVPQAVIGSIEAKESDGSIDLFVIGLEANSGDFDLTQSGDFARLSLARSGYDIAWSIEAAPTASQVVLRFVAVRTVTLPASLIGSVGKAGTAATAQTDFDVQVNGVSKGTVRFAAAGTTASFIFSVAVVLASGDVVTVVAPGTPDATLAKVAVTFAGV